MCSDVVRLAVKYRLGAISLVGDQKFKDFQTANAWRKYQTKTREKLRKIRKYSERKILRTSGENLKISNYKN